MVKQGYKQTEIGVIPEDWEVVKLEQVVNFLDNLRRPIKSSERKSGDYPYYGASGVIDYVDSYIFDDELLLLGEDGENILSRNLPLVYYVNEKCWINNHAHVLKCKNEINPFYLLNKLESLDYTNLNSGTAQPKLNKERCKNIQIPLPPIAEQEVIASALSDADAWIESLEQLIAKKRLIKQGAMQTLLTPPSEELVLSGVEAWEVKKLGEMGTFFSTNSLSRDMLNYMDGNIFNIHYGDIHTKFKTHFNLQKEIVPFISSNLGNIGTICKEGDLIIADASENEEDIGKAIEIVNTDNRKIVAGLHTIHFRPLENIFAIGFLGYLWQTNFIHQSIIKEAQGTKVLGISTSRITAIELHFPKSLSEQERIATMLSDMDAELEALEAQLAKARQIKQGMMQELLTGRTRLV